MATQTINREQFMAYFRSEEFAAEVTPDDRIEIFLGCLTGSSDITLELLEKLCSEYNTSLTNVLRGI
jgi:hypothetical protein